MPDMKDAMRRAGLLKQHSQDAHGNPSHDARAERQGNPFPPGYPRYLTDEGHTRVELVKDEAEQIAAQFESDKLKRNQLRAFYDHAKRQLQRLRYGSSFEEIHPEVARLKAFAADRAARTNNPIPRSFKEFIDRNVDAVRDEKSFTHGFMPHFEAVVGYCARIKD